MIRDVQCSWVAPQLSAFLDGRLDGVDHSEVSAHLEVCRVCSGRGRSLESMREQLRFLSPRRPPATLQARLRVAASHEMHRRRARCSWSNLLAGFSQDLRLWSNNLMRPFALPAAGGLLSAILLFGVISSSMTTRPLIAQGNDVPTGLFTEASVKSFSPLGMHDDEVVVELTIDEQGRMVDYAVSNREALRKCPALRRSLENHLLFTQFTPATTFGQPKAGKIRLSFRASSIEVKG